MSGQCSWFPLRPDEIRAWIEAHRHELPQTLPELSRFPIPFRKAIVRVLPSEVRIALWRDHLTSFIGPGSALTADQQALVRDAIAELPVVFGGSPTISQASALALEARMRQ